MRNPLTIPAALLDSALRLRPVVPEALVNQALRRDRGGVAEPDAPREPIDVRLSPRETDELACAALGQTNAESAAELNLREGTVKSYLQAAMAKLDASTRHAAVTKARRAGLLP